MTAARTVRLRRVYETPEDEDGTRVLVDRLWPRGLSKADARIDVWPKDLTPSTELRRWFHGPGQGEFEEFRSRYEAELDGDAARAALAEVRGLAAKGTVTLLSAVKDLERSHAGVLAERLR
ncbi:DUF488 family protein [Streptomyces sp. LHD-70]|uniref:DUF488 domain-containing protein n=1 Tax=Streptomyces sp. LHD-70 TaxID=3072140 RepID=UPI00280E46B5|nr:DUF488 family protein [Streptomyces sp. LHD-70]MDQ8705869.1 DUF488 family protein [Streptomyces sp. LHD-70]